MLSATLQNDCCFRPIQAEDLPFLLQVYTSTRWEELAQTDWSDAQKHAFCRMQFDAQHRHYQEHYPEASFAIIERGGLPIGRLYVARWEEEIRIVDIALLPEFRGAGVGTGLLRGLRAEAQEAGKRLSIHVEQFNPARRLYDRLGFKPVKEVGVYLLMEFK